jgi:Autophagocytosis associated protein, active-site domain
MAEWSKHDFDVAATHLVSLLSKNDGCNVWSYENDCLVAASTREPKQMDEDDAPPVDVASFDRDTIAFRDLHILDWFVSISYSYIWRVPVLHFTVQTQNGTPLGRHEVLSYLHSYSTDPEDIKANFDFVSIDEHPITGLPAYFLHPCQTTGLLELLRASGTCSTLRLWSWMSMILPRVGTLIRPITFCQIRAEIERNDAEGNN